MKPGKYLFIDIGSAETKIIEASIKHGKITLSQSAIMRDMSLYLSDSHVIKVVEGFCLSLKKTLRDCGIKTRKAIVCSSILGLKTKDISADFHTYKECAAKFSKVYGKSADPTQICDWQFMGEAISDKAIVHKLIMTSGAVNVIENFILAMHRIAGVTVVSLESSLTAQANLHTMYSASFDLPSIAVIDVGCQNVQCQYFKSGAFVYHSTIKPDILNLGALLAEKFSIPLPKVMYLLHNSGIDPDLCDNLLPAEGIEVDSYIQTAQEQIDSFLLELQKNILNVVNSKHLENVRAIFTGGIFSMPGVADYVHKKYNFTPFDIMQVSTSYDTRDFKIVNELNKTLGAEYAGCIGLTLKVFNEIHTTNLVPKELVLIDFGKVANYATFGLIGAAGIGIILAGALSIAPIGNFVSKKDIPAQLHEAEITLKTLQLENNEYSNYLTNISSINKSLTPFMQFLSSYETENLKIASVDTANILEAKVNSTDTTDNLEELTDEEEPQNPLTNLVVRGYAKTSNDITIFYNKLHSNTAVGSLSMNGIREIKLTKQDIIYIFEIALEVTADA